MVKMPLLIFPVPTKGKKEKRKPKHPGGIHYPDLNTQKDRLTPLFDAMMQTFITDNTAGLDPEYVLVLEVIGRIEDFRRAVNQIAGLEWMAEIDTENIEPDEFFYQKDMKQNKINDKALTGRLFLSLSNQQAMNQLLSLWKQWDDSLPQGYAKWAEIFKHLKTIRRWDIEDRLRDTGIRKYWQDELGLKRGTASFIPFEIELWYRNNPTKQTTTETIMKNLIIQEKGRVITTCLMDDIRFHAIKAELPAAAIEKVLEHKDTKIFSDDHVMFFRPVGQICSIPYQESESGKYSAGTTSGFPVVAILDGHPLANHVLLENRINIDDPDNYDGFYQAREYQHGTVMASLVCHGELDANELPLSRPVYLRPIMHPDEKDTYHDPRNERIPADVFFEDLLERAVHRIFEGDNEQDAVAPTVKIINLSICDPARMFISQLSSTSRLLDWLSYKYQVLFLSVPAIYKMTSI